MTNIYDFSQGKDAILRKIRNIGFADIIQALENGKLLEDIDHFNKKRYPNQRIFIIKIATSVYAVPYVKDDKRKVIFLKTIYPSRVLKRKYEKATK